jgi:hypothetical protein
LSSLKDHKSIDEEKAQEVSNSRWKRIVAGVERADNIERTLIFIGVGMAVQVRSPSTYCNFITTDDNYSLLSQYLSSSAPKSSIPAMGCLTIPSKAPGMKYEPVVAKAGNGGSPLFGSYFGLGYMHHTSCGNHAVSVTFTVGAYKPSAAALLGKEASTVCILVLTRSVSPRLRSGWLACTFLRWRL